MSIPPPRSLDLEVHITAFNDDGVGTCHEGEVVFSTELSRSTGDDQNDTDHEGCGEITVNPFALIPVIETLARFLPYLELNNCRLLSKLWLSEMNRERKERQALDIAGEVCEPEFLKNLLRKPISIRYGTCTMTDAKERNFDENPFLYRLLLRLQPTLSHLHVNAYASEPMFHKIMNQIGHNLVDLRLHLLAEMKDKNLVFHKYFPIYDDNDCSKPIIFPNMRIFLVGYIQFFGNQEESRLGLSDFTRTFPNLIEFFPIVLPERGCPKLLKKFNLPNLKSLKLGSTSSECVKPNDLKGLLNLGFKLVRFEIDHLAQGELDIKLLKALLESQSQTLEDIKLLCEFAHRDILSIGGRDKVVNNPVCAAHKTNIPLFPMCVFPKLRSLKIDKSYVNHLGHLLSTFPNMDSLHLPSPGTVKWSGICSKNIPEHQALIVLMFNWVSAADLRIIGNPKHFPNFKKLAIHNTEDKIIRKVMEFFPALYYMSFTDNVDDGLRISDEGLTGLQNLNTLPLHYDDPNLENAVLRNRNKPYIGDCKEMIYFYLNVTSGLVSEKSILYGILDAPNLMEAELAGFKISQEMLNLIKLRGFECVKIESPVIGYILKRTDLLSLQKTFEC